MRTSRTVAIALVAALEVSAPRIALPADGESLFGALFRCPAIVFFGPCPKQPDTTTKSQDARKSETSSRPKDVTVTQGDAPAKLKPGESIWAEVAPGPDGRPSVYLPPKPVLDFLDNPTPENARAYANWNAQRLTRIAAATEVLRSIVPEFSFGQNRPIAVSVSGQGSAVPGAPAVPRVPAAPIPLPAVNITPPSGPPLLQASATQEASRSVSLVYAFASWCPYSRRETPIVDQIAATVPVRAIAFNSPAADVAVLQRQVRFPITLGDDTLRARLGVQSYPTIFVLDGPRVVQATTGFQPAERLRAMVRALGGSGVIPAVSPGLGGVPLEGEQCQLKS